ncbi:MAG: NAD(P)/FAD-dependent oxidoreductase [Saprospiraceae bacterium]|jgi:thioredoxin reductase (NADPH)|nr:NAD(P)/FAD-dependent oxidoreductase [Saprospiraceae bacterium]MBK7797366.1 NAD(P)/FAD-dependent oxidoreductase [Saprospiraceae bacterium]MBL0261541.1 NAD(P)/FAD-dependent oxidoreductase [Saprospiraceae bacterium]
MNSSIQTDIAIIGAGPCGLFTVFEAGLVKLKCHLIDALPNVGGQLSEIYPKKPIYDIPGYPEVLAGDLVANLMKQIEPFKPGFTLGERAETLEKTEDGRFRITTNRNTVIEAPVVCIAGGLGCFEPRKPPIANIDGFEDKGVDYIVRDPEKFRDKSVVIAGGGDSALDWSIFLAPIAKQLVLVHRRTEFRGAPESVDKIMELANDGKIKLIIESEVIGLSGNSKLEQVDITTPQGIVKVATDYYIPLFGLTPKLGPMGDWGLQVDKSAIEVNTFDYSTNIEGIFAVGDINTYPGKLKLILCGFHEATLMVQSAYKIVHKGKKPSFKYTTVTGINRE